MGFKSTAVALTTADQDIFVCGAGTEGSDHGLVFGNRTGSVQTVTVKLWKQSAGAAVTLAVLNVPANDAVPWPKPINLVAGDKIIAAAGANDALTAQASVFEQTAAAPVAVGWTPRGEYDPDATYAANDVASFDGASFISLQDDNTGHEPDPDQVTNTEWWMLNAAQGEAAEGATAATTSFAPAGGLAATDVQAALEELDSEKAAVAHSHAISDVTGLQTALDAKAPLASPALTGNPTAATQTAGNNSTRLATTAFVQAAIAALINSSPGVLDTLDEIAAALGNDPNFAATMTTALAGKVAKSANLSDLADASAARGNLGLAALAVLASVGSAQIDNDAVTYAKLQNISATARVLGRKTAGAGDAEELTASDLKTLLALVKGDVGLGNVDNVAVTGKQSLYIPAGAMVARTTNGAGSGTVETTTNKVMLKSLDFDTSTKEYAQFSLRMPKQWNEGTITFRFIWAHPATTTNFGAAFSLQAIALSNDDAADTAFGTAVTVADTGGTTNDIYHSDESAAVTIGGSPAAEDWVVFQVARETADGGDTLAVDAKLLGVVIFLTTDAGNDA